ncbi:hypothetical protein ACJMK2_016583 [Sinanodonta woodiana]|uniref:SEFIR domain-containing protein n=1 Tax=Sinanodonta woodiana TaxID=1069815 RepID=A0ABD3UVE4_SINWO
MAATGGTGDLPSSTQKQKTGNENIMISKTEQTQEYEQSLKIVLVTVFGVFGFLILIIIVTLLYRLYKKRRRRQENTGSSDRYPSLQRSVSVDLEQKQAPTVLLLYSFDSSAHEKVVSSLAGFLIETCNCNVHLDLFEEQIIHDRGLDEWLIEKLQEVDFVIVLCSIGARLCCSKKKVRFKLETTRTLPDYFAVALDYVAEKMRAERSKGLPLTNFIVLYMDYSTASDIPHQLEMATKYCLMRDIDRLFCHLHGLNGEPTKDGAPYPGISENNYMESEMGKELQVSIESAKEYFRSNPDWVEDRLEQVPNLGRKLHVRRNSQEPLLGSSKNQDLPNIDPLSITSNIQSQTLPRPSVQHNRNQDELMQQLENEDSTQKDSCQSSFGSRQNIPFFTHPLLSSSSRSCDNIQVAVGDNNSPSLCKERHYEDSLEYPAPVSPFLQSHHTETDFPHAAKTKSKSMPAMLRNSLYSSQTVFQVEVHKAWDDLDGKSAYSESQETVSNADSVSDDLERDIKSIIMPVQFESRKNSAPQFRTETCEHFHRGLSMIPTFFLDLSHQGQKPMKGSHMDNFNKFEDSIFIGEQIQLDDIHV